MIQNRSAAGILPVQFGKTFRRPALLLSMVESKKRHRTGNMPVPLGFRAGRSRGELESGKVLIDAAALNEFIVPAGFNDEALIQKDNHVNV
jgi:hypothetical protein